MPEVDAAEHLTDYLFQVGPSTAGEVVTFQEIAAWTALTGVQLSGWEAETLRSLSSAYLSEHQRASDPKRPPPYSGERPIDRKAVSAKLSAVLDMWEKQDAR